MSLIVRTVAAAAERGGEFTAFHLRSNDDGVGEAPYGDHISITSSFWPSAKYSHVIFAGYCSPLKYEWMDARRLNIACVTHPKDGVAKQLESFNGVTIHYEISTSDLRASKRGELQTHASTGVGRQEAENIARTYFRLHVGCGAYTGLSEASNTWGR